LAPRAIGILTDDPALYGELARFLRERQVEVVSLLPGRRVPARVAVLVTSEAEAPTLRFERIVIARPGRMSEAWAAIQVALGHEETPEELVVGVDPGSRPGYAVMDGAQCIASGIAESPEGVALLLGRLRQTFPATPVRFRVGDGDRVHQVRTVNALLGLRSPVELVDERRTTLRGRRDNDVLSAMSIACTPGRRVSHRMDLRITTGEVSNLQRLSREHSGGRYTIPRGYASEVLKGRISLNDALRETARAKRSRTDGSG
jgi:hypothetical protein